MAEDQEEKKKRKRKKTRTGKPRSSKDKRAKRSQGKAALAESSGAPSKQGDGAKGDSNHKKPKSAQAAKEDRDLDNRAWVGGLPPDTDEQVILDQFSSCGTIRNVKLIRNSRLVFRGSCFISFKKSAGLEAALERDGMELNGKTISVRKAAAPVEGPDLKLYIGGLPWKATEEVLKKDFAECGAIAKFHMLKDRETGKFKGAIFVTYKTQAGVDAALKYHDTDYGGRNLTVRLASAAPPPRPQRDKSSGEPNKKDKKAKDGKAKNNADDPVSETAANGSEEPVKGKKKKKDKSSQNAEAEAKSEAPPSDGNVEGKKKKKKKDSDAE